MPSSNASQRARARPRWQAPVVAAGAVVGVMAAIYAASPWIAAALAPRLASSIGFDTLRLSMGRPGLTALTVDTLELTQGRVHLSVGGGTLQYHLAGLLAGRLDAVVVDRLALEVVPEPEAGVGQEGGIAPALSDVPSPASVFAALPARRLSVSALALAVPELGFQSSGSLNVVEGRADLHLVASSPPRAERFELAASADADGKLEIRLGERGSDGAPFVSVTSELATDRLRVRGALDVRGFAFELATTLAGLPPGDGSVGGTFSAEVPWPLPPRFDPGALTADLRISGAWRPGLEPWSIADVAADWKLEHSALSGKVEGTLGYRDEAFLATATASGLGLDGDSGKGDLALSARGGQPRVAVSWTLQPDSLALSGTYRLEGPLLARLAGEAGMPGEGALQGDIRAQVPWPLPSGLSDPLPALPADLSTLSADGSLEGRWRSAQLGFAARDLKGRWTFDGGRAGGTLDGVVSAQGLDVRAGLQLDQGTFDGTSLRAGGVATLGTLVRVPFTAGYDPAVSAGTLSASGTVRIDKPLGGDVVVGWDRPYDATAGRAGVKADLRWTPDRGVEGAVDLELDDVGGHYDEYTMTGLNGTLALVGSKGVWSLSPSAIRLTELQTGVAITDVTSGVAWSRDKVAVEVTTARLLGGDARVGAFVLGLEAGTADLAVDLAGLQLADVLALEGEHVSGDGTLGGRLPVRVRSFVPSIADGRLQSEPPGGLIRVSQALAAGTGQPGLDFALRALQDFHYTELASDVAYSGDGDLTLGVHLQGRNPAIEGGRPIHYNLTVSENLPTLLKSLRLQEDVTRDIERRITD